MTDSGGLAVIGARIVVAGVVAATPALAAMALAPGTAAAASTFAAQGTVEAGGAMEARLDAIGQPMRLKGRHPGIKPNARPSARGVKKSTRRARRRPIKTRWSRSQIRRAQARCATLLRGLDLVVVPLAPMRRNACGTAAPMKLISVGSKPKVMLSPAPTLTCEMAAAMHHWLQRDVQPMARKYLGAPLNRINVMSSYSCRNAYARKHGKLSQHARANALDIRGFETTRGVSTAVLSHWGPRRRRRQAPVLATGARAPKNKAGHPKAGSDKKASLPQNKQVGTQNKRARKTKWRRKREAQLIAAARKAARKFAAKRRARAAAKSKVKTPRTASHRSPVLRGSISGFRAAGAAASKSNDAKAIWNSIFADANYLGANGRRRGRAVARRSPDGINRSAFLHAIHKRACRVFGTVLGPDANFAHRHHFHVDTQKRKLGSYCR